MSSSWGWDGSWERAAKGRMWWLEGRRGRVKAMMAGHGRGREMSGRGKVGFFIYIFLEQVGHDLGMGVGLGLVAGLALEVGLELELDLGLGGWE